MNARLPVTIVVALATIVVMLTAAGCGKILASAQQRYVEQRVERMDPAAITAVPLTAERVVVHMRAGAVHALQPGRIVRVPGDAIYAVSLDRQVEELTLPSADIAHVELTRATEVGRTGAAASSLAWTPVIIVLGIAGALLVVAMAAD